MLTIVSSWIVENGQTHRVGEARKIRRRRGPVPKDRTIEAARAELKRRIAERR